MEGSETSLKNNAHFFQKKQVLFAPYLLWISCKEGAAIRALKIQNGERVI